MPRTFHQIALKHLLSYRENNPDFIFIPRQRNTNNRFEQGFCFQGNDGYAFVGLINKSGGINKTRSVGLVFYPTDEGIECHFEIVHKGESDEGLIHFYDTLKEEFNHGKESYENQKFVSHIGTVYPDDATELYDFLDLAYPKVRRVALESGINDLFISESKFEKLINTIKEYDTTVSIEQSLPQLILINLTWNSKDWKEPSVDISNHRYVQDGNVPGESWNFKKDASWNDEDYIYGYAQFTNQPTIQENLLLIFHSQGKIVGFYGDANIGNFTEEAFKNLSGARDLSFVLENKIDDIKEKGFLEDKERIGQIGFTYLQKPETFESIIKEAIHLNPNQEKQLLELMKWYKSSSDTYKLDQNMSNKSEEMDSLNQILYGPPGTGKTYSTIAEAIQIIDPAFYKNNSDDREKIVVKYQELLISNWDKPSGQIAFTTFHQSFSYEDFVEGIKPLLESEDLRYQIEDGIFKKMCSRARGTSNINEIETDKELSWDEETFNQSIFYKLSLGEASNPEDDVIYDYCVNNNMISLGFVSEVDLTGKTQSKVREICEEHERSTAAAQMLNTFLHGLQEGDYVVISKGNRIVRALGKITSGYFYDQESEIEYAHFRKVEWIFKDQELPAKEIYENNLSQRSLYKLDQELIKKNFFVKNSTSIVVEEEIVKDYVLIIDEINRGNVASIFGELISLIEKDKRVGAENELSVILPYSKQKLSVPSNLHLIGTMNTADRSIEALDSALRRRFEFKEMMPDYKVIDELLDHAEFEGFKISDILKTINERLTVLLDRDHQIGHSYFLKLKDSKNLNEGLKTVFTKKIIPLLQEYFFNDYVKIAMVIGEGFLEPVSTKNMSFANSKYSYASDYDEIEGYEIRSEDDINITDALEKLMNIGESGSQE